jgi:hypothetical protein
MHDVGQRVAFVDGKRFHIDDGPHVNFGECPVAGDG